MINKKDQISFIRNFLVCDGIDFFLGSGASLLAGIPSGQNLVWEFKKEIYCSENNYADVVRTLDLLLKYPGMAGHDHKTVEEFKEAYPQKLTTKMIMDFEDIKDLYRRYLESGGENDE